jgi:hypothetical protein
MLRSSFVMLVLKLLDFWLMCLSLLPEDQQLQQQHW